MDVVECKSCKTCRLLHGISGIRRDLRAVICRVGFRFISTAVLIFWNCDHANTTVRNILSSAKLTSAVAAPRPQTAVFFNCNTKTASDIEVIIATMCIAIASAQTDLLYLV